MKTLGYLLQYWTLSAAGFLFRALPLKATLGLGAGLGLLVYGLGIRRGVALSNLERVFPERQQRWRKAIAGSLYRNLGRNLAELLRFPAMSRTEVLNAVEFRGLEHFEEARKGGRGALLVTAHFGNWELYGAAIACAGYPLSMVVYPQHNRRVDEQLNRLRRGKGSEIIYKRDAAREIFRALRQNRFVAVLIDQDAGSDGIFCDFLGHPASTARGPALLAYKSGAPLIPGAIVRKSQGGHLGLIHGIIRPNCGAPAESEVRRVTSELNSIISGYVMEHPDHWYWVHRRWKTRPPAPSGKTR
jgi:KDO2-lipid IV(A) lauroyltransferase